MTPSQRNLARHALGLPNRRRQSYRNRFVAPYRPCATHDAWSDMLDAGEADSHPPRNGMQTFWLTYKGALAALEPGETLDLEDFPEARK